MPVISPPLFATWLGYLTAAATVAALALNIAALRTRSDGLDRLSVRLAAFTAILIIPATIHGLASYILSFQSALVHTQLFVAGSLFTLALALADWHARDTDVLWKADNRILYLSGYVGCLGLAVALIWMG